MISILMSSYDEDLALLRGAIDSIFGQPADQDVELVLVLDDPRNAPVAEWARMELARKPNVKVIQNERNLGLARSLNAGLAVAEGDYVCRMDADDLSLPSRLQCQLDYLEEHNLDLIGGPMEVMDHRGQPLYAVAPLPTSPAAFERASRWNNCMPHPTWFGKRAVFEGGYRDIPFCEDYDFQLRSLLQGFKLANCEEVVLRYRLSPTGISMSNLLKQYLSQRCLTKAFRQGRIVDAVELSACIERCYSAASAARYSKAHITFNKGLELVGKRRLSRGVAKMASIPFISPRYVGKVMRLGIAAMAGRSH